MRRCGRGRLAACAFVDRPSCSPFPSRVHMPHLDHPQGTLLVKQLVNIAALGGLILILKHEPITNKLRERQFICIKEFHLNILSLS